MYLDLKRPNQNPAMQYLWCCSFISSTGLPNFSHMKNTTAVNEVLWLLFSWPKERLINQASQSLQFLSSLQYAEPDKVTRLDMQGASFRSGDIGNRSGRLRTGVTFRARAKTRYNRPPSSPSFTKLGVNFAVLWGRPCTRRSYICRPSRGAPRSRWSCSGLSGDRAKAAMPLPPPAGQSKPRALLCSQQKKAKREGEGRRQCSGSFRASLPTVWRGQSPGPGAPQRRTWWTKLLALARGARRESREPGRTTCALPNQA